MDVNFDCFHDDRHACSSQCQDRQGNMQCRHMCASDGHQCTRVAKKYVSFMGQPRIAVCTFHAPTVEDIKLVQKQNIQFDSVFTVKQQMRGDDLRNMRTYLNMQQIPFKMDYGNNTLTFRTTSQNRDWLQNRVEAFIGKM
jgi:hypothetical protein